MHYRPEIDGLRALAVVPVILFHAGFELFSGGFVGVDVFFVISGYLITSLLIEDIENKRFSILNFYERRARRILPALFFVILVCIPFAWMWMMPNKMKDFSQSLIAVSLFVSNILFWRESGYFGAASEEKPLLHTWSLAVEEQYYVLFPIFLILAWRFGRNRVFWMIVFMASISLILSEWGWRNKPIANFYLAPTRAWELFAGSIVAFIIQKQGIKKNNELALIGLSAIIFSIFFYDETTPFPSIYALVPVLGSALVILYAGKETLVYKLLSTKAFVGIGLVSYSAYLWHHPLFAFSIIKLSSLPSTTTLLLLVTLSFILAFLSWKYIEQPFRSKKIFTTKKIFGLSILGVIIFLSFGLYGHMSDGFKSSMINYKFTDVQRQEFEAFSNALDYDMYNEMASSECNLWISDTKNLDIAKLKHCNKLHGKAIVVLGDSHAMNLFNIFSYSGEYKFIIGVSKGGCRAHDITEKCHYDNFDNFAFENSELIDLIIYHQSGSYFIKDLNKKVDSQAAFEGSFGGYSLTSIDKVVMYLEKLSKNSNSEVLWIGPFLEFRRTHNFYNEKIRTVNPQSIHLFSGLNELLLKTLSKNSTISYARFNTLFSEPVDSFYEDCFVFRDIDHYSKCGEKLVSKSLNKSIIHARRNN